MRSAKSPSLDFEVPVWGMPRKGNEHVSEKGIQLVPIGMENVHQTYKKRCQSKTGAF